MSKIEYDYAVVLGRFQPLHNAHVKLLERAFEVAHTVIVVVGSHRSTSTVKNPFTTDERYRMIDSSLSVSQVARTFLTCAKDSLYNENLWLTDVQTRVSRITGEDKKIAIVGSLSDDSSYYLKSFPRWKWVFEPQLSKYHATDIRRMWFEGDDTWKKQVPTAVVRALIEKKEKPEFQDLLSEYNFIKDYRNKWSSAPYPPTFVTVDVVVIKSGHVLVVKRKIAPGKGLFALPGGFVNQKETVKAAGLREGHEETGIYLDENDLKSTMVFDHPDRSLRGRTITHAMVFDLGNGELPVVKGGDDASDALWMSMRDVEENSELFFEDHRDIIQAVLYRN